jgi:hypothetical protein
MSAPLEALLQKERQINDNLVLQVAKMAEQIEAQQEIIRIREREIAVLRWEK